MRGGPNSCDMSKFYKMGRFYRTHKHLKMRQMVGQIRLRTKRNVFSFFLYPKIKGPPFEGFVDIQAAPVPRPYGKATKVKTGSGEFLFINQMKRLGWPPDWRPADSVKLWRYNLHYFEWLWGCNYADSKYGVSDWIENYPFNLSHEGWEPYPVSLRLQNWCLWFLLENRNETLKDIEFSKQLWNSVAGQCEWLSKNLETHILGNHYLENGLALYVAGSLFKGSSADRWQDQGRSILFEQIEEQMLEDGMHFERSPMYHQRFCYILLVAVSVAEDENDRLFFSNHASKALRALQKLLHPDGEVSLLNDAAIDIYSHPKVLFEWAERLKVLVTRNEDRSWSLPQAGMYGWLDERGDYLAIKAGEIGPSYQPGHAHADAFSFELSLNGQRVLVDSGVSGYAAGADRAYDRSTEAHNTVEIAGLNQSEVWGSFRLGRRATPKIESYEASENGFELAASHDGYRFLKGRPVHRRVFRWEDRTLSIVDEILNHGRHSVLGFWHFDPSCRISRISPQEYAVNGPFGCMAFTIEGRVTVAIEERTVCKRFGVKERSCCLVIRHSTDKTSFRLSYK